MRFNVKDLKKIDRDDLLELIGLQTRTSAAEWILPSVGLFAAGLLVGAGIGIMLAPKSGRELREDLRTRMQGHPEALPGGAYRGTGVGADASPSRTL